MTGLLRSGESRGRPFVPWRTLLLTALALAAYLAFGPAPEAWVFDREAIERGEFWRLVTGHWVHSGFEHALWDVGGLAVLGVLFERRLRAHLFMVLLVGALGMDAWLWWGAPWLDLYCGLSGILHSLLVVGLLRAWRERPHPLVPLTGLLFVAKMLMEAASGGVLFAQTGWVGVPEAHLAGLLAGVVFEVVRLLGSGVSGYGGIGRQSRPA